MTCPYEDCLLGVEAWKIENNTDPAICKAILLMLEDWDPTQPFVTFSNPQTLWIAQAQDKIGWLHTIWKARIQ
jgi:hypothetical protein